MEDSSPLKVSMQQSISLPSAIKKSQAIEVNTDGECVINVKIEHYGQERPQGEEPKVAKYDKSDLSPTPCPPSGKHEFESCLAGGILSEGIGSVVENIAKDCGAEDTLASAIGGSAGNLAHAVSQCLPTTGKSAFIQGAVGVVAVAATTDGTVADKAKAVGRVVVTEAARSAITSTMQKKHPIWGYFAGLGVDLIVAPTYDWIVNHFFSKTK